MILNPCCSNYSQCVIWFYPQSCCLKAAGLPSFQQSRAWRQKSPFISLCHSLGHWTGGYLWAQWEKWQGKYFASLSLKNYFEALPAALCHNEYWTDKKSLTRKQDSLTSEWRSLKWPMQANWHVKGFDKIFCDKALLQIQTIHRKKSLQNVRMPVSNNSQVLGKASSSRNIEMY